MATNGYDGADGDADWEDIQAGRLDPNSLIPAQQPVTQPLQGKPASPAGTPPPSQILGFDTSAAPAAATNPTPQPAVQPPPVAPPAPTLPDAPAPPAGAADPFAPKIASLRDRLTQNLAQAQQLDATTAQAANGDQTDHPLHGRPLDDLKSQFAAVDGGIQPLRAQLAAMGQYTANGGTLNAQQLDSQQNAQAQIEQRQPQADALKGEIDARTGAIADAQTKRAALADDTKDAYTKAVVLTAARNGSAAIQSDLANVLAGGAIDQRKAELYTQAGLLVPDTQADGSTILRVSKGALSTLPKPTQAQIAANPEAYNVATDDAPGDAVAKQVAKAAGKVPTPPTASIPGLPDPGVGNIPAGNSAPVAGIPGLPPPTPQQPQGIPGLPPPASDSWGPAKALAYGAAKAGGFLAASAPGAALGAEVGALGGPLAPFTVPIGSVLGGLVSGTLGSKAVEGAAHVVAPSVVQASQDHPYYDMAGNLVGFAAGLPKIASTALADGAEAIAGKLSGKAASIAQGTAENYANSGGLASTVGNLAQDATNRVASGATAGQAATAIASRVIGRAATNVAIDTAIKQGAQALGMSDQGQTLSGATQAALIGAFTAGHGLGQEGYTPADVANIAVRAKLRADAGLAPDSGTLSPEQMPAGIDSVTAQALSKPLTPKEMEVSNRFDQAITQLQAEGKLPANATGADVADFARRASAVQSTDSGHPYGVTSIRIDPASPAPDEAAAAPSQLRALPLPSPSQDQTPRTLSDQPPAEALPASASGDGTPGLSPTRLDQPSLEGKPSEQPASPAQQFQDANLHLENTGSLIPGLPSPSDVSTNPQNQIPQLRDLIPGDGQGAAGDVSTNSGSVDTSAANAHAVDTSESQPSVNSRKVDPAVQALIQARDDTQALLDSGKVAPEAVPHTQALVDNLSQQIEAAQKQPAQPSTESPRSESAENLKQSAPNVQSSAIPGLPAPDQAVSPDSRLGAVVPGKTGDGHPGASSEGLVSSGDSTAPVSGPQAPAYTPTTPNAKAALKAYNALNGFEADGQTLTPGQIQTRRNAQAVLEADGMPEPMYQPRAPRTPAEAQALSMVHQAIARDPELQQVAQGLGVKGIAIANLGGASSSGLAYHNGHILVDPSGLQDSAQEMTPDKVQAWLHHAAAEEVIHHATRQAVPPSHLAAIANDADSKELADFMAKAYTGWHNLSDEQKGAEMVRAVIQGKWHGTITERIWAAIRYMLAHLRSILAKMPENSILKEAVARTEAVLKGAGAKFETASRQPESQEPLATAKPAVDDGGTLSNDDGSGDRPQENRGAFGERPAYPPDVPAALARRGGPPDPGSRPYSALIGREAVRQAAVLEKAAQDSGQQLSPGQIMRLGPLAVEGQEHQVRASLDGQRVVKMTSPGRGGYGLTPYVKGGGEIGYRPGTPAEYLDRLALQNKVFGDDIRYEGIVRDVRGEPRIVTSQPTIAGTRPTSSEIARYMESKGFEPVSGQEGNAYYRASDNVAVLDAHEGNLIKSAKGVTPIDVVTVHPDDRLLQALERGLGGEALHGAKPIAMAPGASVWDETKESLGSAIGVFRGAMDDVQKLVAAHTIPGAEEPARILQEAVAKMDRANALMANELHGVNDLVAKLSPADRKNFRDALEGNAQLSDPAQQTAADKLRDFDTTRMNALRTRFAQLGLDGLQNFTHFYKYLVPHLFAKPDVASAVIQRRIEKGTGFLQHRVIPTWKDIENLQAELRAQGRNEEAAALEPASDNPVEMMVARFAQQESYLAAQFALKEAADTGSGKWMPTDYQPRPGEVRVDPKIGTRQVANRMEYMFMPQAGARIFNNYLSPGLRDKDWFRAYLGASNALNMFQLGFSAFHAGFTAVDTMTSKLALALNQMASGRGMDGLKSLAEVPFSPIITAMRGDKLVKEWSLPGSQGPEVGAVLNAIISGGGAAGVDPFYANQAWKSMMEDFRSGDLAKYGRGVLKAPFAVSEQAMRPIMEYLVPRMKMGVAADMVRAWMKDNPNATHQELRTQADKIVRSADNRLGQLRYTNLHWNKVVKDLAMASMRSVGWNIGTLRELGGGLADWAKFAATGAKRATGDASAKPEFTYRMAYTLALPLLTGMMGALVYLARGKTPQSLKDYFYPETGALDEQGRAERIAFPSYMKDVVAYSSAPLTTVQHKLNPLLSTMGDMLENEDFYGTKIRNEDDPLVKQIESELGYVGQQFEPFAFRGTKQMGDNASLASKALPFIGITPAPASVTNTRALNLANQFLAARAPAGGRTSADAARSAAKNQIVSALRAGNAAPLNEALTKGQLSQKDAALLRKRAALTPLQYKVALLHPDEAEKVLAAASPAEKAEISGLVEAKAARAKVQQPAGQLAMN